jgi:hypothetical protein
VLGLLAITWLAAPAGAKWAATASGSGAAQSTTLAPPPTVTASCGLLRASVKLDWTASPSPWVTQYEVRWGTSADPQGNATLVTGLTFTTPGLATGTWYFTVRSTKGAWRSTATASNPASKVILVVVILPVCL